LPSRGKEEQEWQGAAFWQRIDRWAGGAVVGKPSKNMLSRLSSMVPVGENLISNLRSHQSPQRAEAGTLPHAFKSATESCT
jgi:hypothetical protein